MAVNETPGDLWAQTEAILFTRDASCWPNKIHASHFPPYIAVSDELERQSTGPVLRRARQYLVIRAANGRARYELVERRPGQSLWRRDFGQLDPSETDVSRQTSPELAA